MVAVERIANLKRGMTATGEPSSKIRKLGETIHLETTDQGLPGGGGLPGAPYSFASPL